MSWQWFVFGFGDQVWPPVWALVPGPHCGVALAHGCCGVDGVFWRPFSAPVVSFLNSRGSLTIAAVAGAASGTLMTSMRHWDGFGLVAAPPSQPSSSVAARTPAVPCT